MREKITTKERLLLAKLRVEDYDDHLNLRKLQREELEHLTKPSEYYRDWQRRDEEQNKETRTLTMLSPKRQIEIYSSCFEFPLARHFGPNDQVYVTTSRNLDKLSGLLEDLDISTKKIKDKGSHNFCEIESQIEGILTPKWEYTYDTYEGHSPHLSKIAFFAFDKPIYSITGYLKKEWEQSDNETLRNHSINLTRTKGITYSAETFYFCSDCLRDCNNIAQKMSKEGQVLKLDEPVIFYNPDWIRSKK